MVTFPLKQPLDSKSFISSVCHLYKKSVIKLLPFSILCVAMLGFMRFGNLLLPKHAPLFQQLSMFVLILLFPAIGMIFSCLDKIAKQQSFSYGSILLAVAKRFISFMGCLFSMTLLPLIVLALCIGGYLFLSHKLVPYFFLFLWVVISYFLLVATLITKIIAPILVLTDNQDANDAVDTSERLIKGSYFQAFIYTLYAILLLVFLIKLPMIIHFFLPSLTNSLSPLLLEGFAQVLLILIGPWSFALLLAYKYDLQARHPEASIPLQKPSPKPSFQKENVSGKKPETKEQDKFNF